MNPAPQYRASLTALVALTAVAVIAGLVTGSAVLERIVPRLPPVPTAHVAPGFAGGAPVAPVGWSGVRLARATRTRSRRTALEAAVRGELSSGIRSRLLERRLNDLVREDASTVRLGSRFSVVVDELGIAFWNGGRRPRRAAQFPWREVRNIRADSMVVGSSVVQVVVLRVRHHGASIELPIILAAGRVGRYALADAPFYAVVRSWKAKHRAALAAEGLELPPLTAPIPIITPAQAAAARR
ncbi:hypothetical protein [Agromyces sp. Marseille-P2726]|uniref:hypothetical protein n=1 Tax=Agromyces sp. Marseille-P2726 TaxID=2709132 RepID=UPI00156DE432|nr:hypothetical protein [Agromyces sp. Marseille-P2726]